MDDDFSFLNDADASGGNENNFFGGDDFFDDSNSNNSNDNNTNNSSNDNSAETLGDNPTPDTDSTGVLDDAQSKKLKKVAVYGIAAAVVIIVFVAIVARIVYNNKSKDSTDEVITHEEIQVQKQSQVQQVPIQTQVSSNSDWKSVDFNSIGKIGGTEKREGIFVVNEFNTYARVLNGEEFQVKTEVTGSISGLAGTYKIEIPFDITPALKSGIKLNVEYNLINSDGNTIVGNIVAK